MVFRPSLSTWIVTLIVCLIGVSVTATQAQTVEEYRGRTGRLLEAWRVVDSIADHADSVLSERTQVDTIQVRTLFTLAPPDRSRGLTAGVRLAWNELSHALGADTTLLNDVAFYFPVFRRRATAPRVIERDVKQARVQGNLPARVSRTLVRAFEYWLSEDMDSTAEQWLGRSITVSAEPVNFERLYIEALTAPSPLVRNCGAGNLAACKRALDFNREDDPITAWYDEEGRRGLVRGLPGLINRDREAAAVCLERKWDQICVALLQLLPRTPPPFSYETRAELVRFALQRGGANAYSRFKSATLQTADGINVGVALGYAAGIDQDTLLAEWRAAFVSAQPGQVTFQLRTAMAVLLWTAVFFGTALRATRWR